MGYLAPYPWGDQVREFAESLAAAIAQTGGLALIALYPLLPVLLLFGGLQAVGRGSWSKGTESKKWAKEVLSYETDPMVLAVARNILAHYEP
jgi:hypothetical protein